MKTRYWVGNRWILSVVLLVCGGLVWRVGISSSNALTQKALTHWFQGRQWYDHRLTPEQNEAKRKKIVGQLRKQAVPFVVNNLNRHDTWLDALATSRTIPVFLRNALIHHRQSEDIRADAADALRFFGNDAKPAIPRLISMLQNGSGTGTGVDVAEASKTLMAMGVDSREFTSAIKSATNHGTQRLGLYRLLALGILEPTNKVHRTELALVLNPDSPGFVRSALTTAGYLSDVGPRASVVAPNLRTAIVKSYLTWPMPALARFAHALWKAEGRADMAVQVFDRATNEIALATSEDRPELENSLVELATRLGSIPEFAARIKPVILASTNGPLFRARDEMLGCLEPPDLLK